MFKVTSQHDLIPEFQGEFRFLSNFHDAPIVINGKHYPTTEHYYQAMKASNEDDHELIRNAPTAGKAKRLGQKIQIRDDWDEIKDQIMYQATTEKFNQNPDLAQLLMGTQQRSIQEGNRWNDTYWGVSLDSGEGQNRLGKILEQVREELLNKQQQDL